MMNFSLMQATGGGGHGESAELKYAKMKLLSSRPSLNGINNKREVSAIINCTLTECCLWTKLHVMYLE